jgi:hypothetical protein
LDSATEEPAPRTGDLLPAVSAVKPLLRGWLHWISFEASLVLGTLALVNAHGAARMTAIAVFAVRSRRGSEPNLRVPARLRRAGELLEDSTPARLAGAREALLAAQRRQDARERAGVAGIA